MEYYTHEEELERDIGWQTMTNNKEKIKGNQKEEQSLEQRPIHRT